MKNEKSRKRRQAGRDNGNFKRKENAFHELKSWVHADLHKTQETEKEEEGCHSHRLIEISRIYKEKKKNWETKNKEKSRGKEKKKEQEKQQQLGIAAAVKLN